MRLVGLLVDIHYYTGVLLVWRSGVGARSMLSSVITSHSCLYEKTNILVKTLQDHSSCSEPRWAGGKEPACQHRSHLVKAIVFPVVMYGWEGWTIKKAEC